MMGEMLSKGAIMLSDSSRALCEAPQHCSRWGWQSGVGSNQPMWPWQTPDLAPDWQWGQGHAWVEAVLQQL